MKICDSGRFTSVDIRVIPRTGFLCVIEEIRDSSMKLKQVFLVLHDLIQCSCNKKLSAVAGRATSLIRRYMEKVKSLQGARLTSAGGNAT